MRYQPILSRVLILSTLVLTACGGSGGPSPSPGGNTSSTPLLVQTGAGAEAALEGRLLVAALERSDAAVTANLLGAPAEIALADPRGTPSGVRLAQAPAGSYVALRLMFAADSLRARLPDGTLAVVRTARLDLRVAFEGGQPFAAGPNAGVVLAHLGPIDLTAQPSGEWLWNPALTARPSAGVPLEDAPLRLMSIDRGAKRAVGMLSTAQDLPVTIDFGGSIVLTGRSGSTLSHDDFLSELEIESDLTVDGLLGDDGSLHCRYAHHHARHGEIEGKAYGRIASIDPAQQSFVLDVQALIVRGVLTPASMSQMTVLAGGAVVHRSHHPEPLATFADLLVGMRVEVEWNGRVGDAYRAHEVEIEDEPGGSHQRGEIEGRVGSVDPQRGVIVVFPRGNDPLIVMGKSVASAEVEVWAGTAIFRKGDHLVPIAIGDITTSDRIWIIGEVLAPQRVRADWIRVESENR